jgi:hypothetical protein
MLSAPGSLSLRHLEWRAATGKVGAPTTRAAVKLARDARTLDRMERREAQPRTQLGARAFARRAGCPIARAA